MDDIPKAVNDDDYPDMPVARIIYKIIVWTLFLIALFGGLAAYGHDATHKLLVALMLLMVGLR